MAFPRTCISICVFTLAICRTSLAVTISVNKLELLPPVEPVNVVEVSVSGNFLVGSDTEKPELSGWSDVDLELDMSSGDPQLTGFSFTAGEISLSDVSFSLAFGNVTATTVGLGGSPSTPSPPGAVVNETLNAVDHLFTINTGLLVAAGETTDFAIEPLEAAGDGVGFAVLTEVLPASSATRFFEIRIDLPIVAQQVLTVDNVPLIGTTDIDVDVSGLIVSKQSFEIQIPNGDFNLDGTTDCDDLSLLYDRADVASDHATFDIDGDGTVNAADANAWVAARGFSVGDANLDGAVDGADLDVWRANRFTANGDWCHGDFNADGFVDGSDFNQWNDNHTMAASTAPVPEPSTMALWLIALSTGVGLRRR